MLNFTDVGSWGSAPVGYVENFVRLYARGHVRVAHEARAGGDPSVTDGRQDGAIEHSSL